MTPALSPFCACCAANNPRAASTPPVSAVSGCLLMSEVMDVTASSRAPILTYSIARSLQNCKCSSRVLISFPRCVDLGADGGGAYFCDFTPNCFLAIVVISLFHLLCIAHLRRIFQPPRVVGGGSARLCAGGEHGKDESVDSLIRPLPVWSRAQFKIF